jgi:uncharacterized protein
MDHVLAPEEDADVPGFCRALGVPGLADIHVHFLPPRLLRRVWRYFDEAGPLVGVSWPVRYKWSDEERVAHLRSMGVRMFSALAYAHRPEMAADLNEWTLEFGRANPGCLPSATFYPEPGVTRYVRAALDAGARIFKVHLQVGGFAPDDPQLDEVWGLLAEERVPVVVHAGHAPVGTENTGPGPFGALMARYPELTAIVAHLGAPDYGAFLRMAADSLTRTRGSSPGWPGWTWVRTGCARCAGITRWRCSGCRRQRRRPASSPATRSRGRAGVRRPSRPVMSSLATSALTTASSVAWTAAS